MGRSTYTENWPDDKIWGCQELIKCAILGVNGVAMARHGLILSQDGATSLGKVFKYLPGLRDTIKTSKITKKTENRTNIFLHIYIYIYPYYPYHHFLIKGVVGQLGARPRPSCCGHLGSWSCRGCAIIRGARGCIASRGMYTQGSTYWEI